MIHWIVTMTPVIGVIMLIGLHFENIIIDSSTLIINDRTFVNHLIARQDVLEAFQNCQLLCYDIKNQIQADLWNNGICILANSTGWSCDIAHCPRIPVDELKVNQCNNSRWIELDTSCGWLRYRYSLNESRQAVECSADGTSRLQYPL